jgi:hypothetical protein
VKPAIHPEHWQTSAATRTNVHAHAMKSLKYVVLLLAIVQIALPYCIPLKYVYSGRMDYEIVKNQVRNLDVVLEKIRLEIRRNHLQDYILLLGDSVMYGSPGDSGQSVTVFMEEAARRTLGEEAPAIFNLAFPAMQLGDLYALLLKLDRYGISTERTIINVRYACFVPREPDPPAVFWLQDDLRSLDRDAYKYIFPQLEQNGYSPPSSVYGQYKHWLEQSAVYRFKPYAYKDYIRKMLQHAWLRVTHQPIPSDAIGDPRPWYVKGDLEPYLNSSTVKQSFTDKPLDLTEENPDIYFLQKIIGHQTGKDTLLVMTGTNHTLMNDYVEKPGYVQNMISLDRYLQSQPIRYVNLEGQIPDRLFSDHTHLTPDGYRELADLIWQSYAALR